MAITILNQYQQLKTAKVGAAQGGYVEAWGEIAFTSTSTSGTFAVPLRTVSFVSVQQVNSTQATEKVQPSMASSTANGIITMPQGNAFKLVRSGTATSGLQCYFYARGTSQ